MGMQPPRWADRFLKWFCKPDLLEDLQGDLYEIFYHHCEQGNVRKARYTYAWLVFRSFRPSAIKHTDILKNSIFTMTQYNLKVALRVLWRDKFNSAINLLGLTLGITCFLLLGLYVKQELSFDRHNTKKDRIFRTWLKEDYGEGREFFNSHTPMRFESLLEDNFPEVERSVQYVLESFMVGDDENMISESLAIISPDFFQVFDFDLLLGNTTDPLANRTDLIISRSYALKYFGDIDAVGQSLKVQLDTAVQEFVVSAVIEDMPKESSIRFDLAISADNGLRIFGADAYKEWFTVIAETYVLLRETTAVASVEAKIQDVLMTHLGGVALGEDGLERDQYNIGFQKLTDIHLNPEIPLGNAPVNNPQYIVILSVIALLVLFMACVNYTTLAIGQSMKRSREVGVRKVLGAEKPALVYQYLSESTILSMAAMAIAIGCTVLLIPTFNALTDWELVYSFAWWHVAACCGLGLVIGFGAGAYPALIASAFRTISILSGRSQAASGSMIRKSLLVVQLLIATFLISTVLIMRDQLNFLLNKNLGYDYSTVVSARLPVDPESRGVVNTISSGIRNGELLRSKLEQHPEISKVAMGSHLFGSNGWANMAFTDTKGDFKWFRLLVANPEYLNAFNIPIVEGRGFETGNGLDERQSILLNQTAVKYLGLKDPLGSKLPGNRFGEHQIIGVVRDFHYSSLHTEIEPLVIVQNIMPIAQGVSDVNSSDSIDPKIVFTYTGPNLHGALDILRTEWEATFPTVAWNYEFIDERIKSQYQNEVRLGKLILTAAALAILIASLGLFGLMMLISNNKIKEIGIRKVMGASAVAIFKLLLKGFKTQLIIAMVISVPLTIQLANQWLENFAYRTEISALPFVLGGIIVMLIAASVIGYHTFRATRVNPVKSLRVE